MQLVTSHVLFGVLAAAAGAQQLTKAESTFPRSTLGGQASTWSVLPQGNLVAALPFDGVATWLHNAQDFESIWDQYDVFIIEDIEPESDASLGMFRTRGSGTAFPDVAEDFVVRVFENNGTGFPGQDSYTGSLVVQSVPGAGFFTFVTSEFITEFGGQCLTAGSYFLVWQARLDFNCCGQAFFWDQAGEPTVGGGEANNAWHWNPGEGYGFGTHAPIVDPPTGLPTGVNYLLFGEPSNCGDGCSNPDCPADLDLDGDADSDDFFLYLDRFAGGDPCADIDGDADSDSDDFFAYLDLFAAGC